MLDAKKSPKIRRLGTIAQLCWAISSQLRHVSIIRKNLLNSNISPTCPSIRRLLVAEIVLLVWGTRANFNGFRVLAALLHGTPVLGVSQTLRRWTEGATYIRQGGYHVGHWPTFSFECLIWISFALKAPTNSGTLYALALLISGKPGTLLHSGIGL